MATRVFRLADRLRRSVVESHHRIALACCNHITLESYGLQPFSAHQGEARNDDVGELDGIRLCYSVNADLCAECPAPFMSSLSGSAQCIDIHVHTIRSRSHKPIHRSNATCPHNALTSFPSLLPYYPQQQQQPSPSPSPASPRPPRPPRPHPFSSSPSPSPFPSPSQQQAPSSSAA